MDEREIADDYSVPKNKVVAGEAELKLGLGQFSRRDIDERHFLFIVSHVFLAKKKVKLRRFPTCSNQRFCNH
jgi:hypothetical protein